MESARVPYDINHFKSRDHGEVLNELRSRKFVDERRIQLEDPWEFSKFIQEINNRGWQVLATPIYEINIDIIREFYVNSKRVV